MLTPCSCRGGVGPRLGLLALLLASAEATAPPSARRELDRPPQVAPRPLKADDVILLSRGTASDAAHWSLSHHGPADELTFTDEGLRVDSRAAPTQGQRYVGVAFAPTEHEGVLSKAALGSVLGLQLRIAGNHWGWIRVRDSTQQTFQGSWTVNSSTPPRDADGWASIRQVLDPSSFHSHFQGAADGRIHLPISQVEFDLGTAAASSFELANLSLSCCGCPLAKRDTWQVSTGTTISPGSIGVVTAEVATSKEFRVAVRLQNSLQRTQSLQRLSLELRADDANTSATGGAIGCLSTRALSVEGWATELLTCRPSLPLVAGYYSIHAELISPAAGSLQYEGGLVVLQANLSSTPAVGAFGSQYAHSALPELRAMGMSNLRVWVFWRFTEGKEGGPYTWSAADDQIKQAVSAGMRVTLTIASRAPTWAKWSQDPSGAWPDPAKLDRLRVLCQLATQRYGHQIDSIEIDNEPDAMFDDLHLPLATAAQEYERIVAACSAGVRAVSNLTLVGLSVNGQGFWSSKGGNLTFARKVLADPATANALSAVSVHPYSRSHCIPATAMPWCKGTRCARWSMPNATDDGVGLEGRLNLTVDVMRQADKAPRLWPTEFGFQLFVNASFASWWAHTHAAAVAQSLLLMRGNAAVERFFLFDAYGGSSVVRAGTSYGMLVARGPRPALAAFATAALFTDSPRYAAGRAVDLCGGPRCLNASAIHYAGRGPTAGADTLAVWTNGAGRPDDDTRAQTAVRLDPAPAAAHSGLGRALAPAAFNLSAMPTFIRCAPGGVGGLVEQLRRQLRRPG